MQRISMTVLAAILAVGLLVAGCGQAAPPPSPTTAPVAPVKAAEPTKAPAAPTKALAPQPTTAPAPKVAFPEKGKTITVIIGSPAGGVVDVGARILAPLLEKELGTSIAIVNKPGGTHQVALTELVRSKPDGYTIAWAPLPQAATAYLDPERKAIFDRRSFELLATQVVDPGAIAVTTGSPYKTLKDLVDAAKASPGKIKAATTGAMSDDHFAVLQFEKAAGVDLRIVHYQGGPPATTALLGGEIDVYFDNVGTFPGLVKNGQVRVLGIMDRQGSKFLPGVKTMEEQGVKVYSYVTRAVVMPAGAPQGVVDTLVAALKKTITSQEHVQKMEEAFFPVRYMDPKEFSEHWAEVENEVKPLIELAKQEQ